MSKTYGLLGVRDQAAAFGVVVGALLGMTVGGIVGLLIDDESIGARLVCGVVGFVLGRHGYRYALALIIRRRGTSGVVELDGKTLRTQLRSTRLEVPLGDIIDVSILPRLDNGECLAVVTFGVTRLYLGPCKQPSEFDQLLREVRAARLADSRIQEVSRPEVSGPD